MKAKKITKRAFTLTTLAVLLFVVVPVALAWPFNDVPPGYWAYDQIHRVANMNITSGCGGGNYCPLNPVNRDQMAVFMDNLTKAWTTENEPYLYNLDHRRAGGAHPALIARSNDGNGLNGISYGGGIADNGVYGETNSPDQNEAGVYGYATDWATGVKGHSVHNWGGIFSGQYGVSGYGNTGWGGYLQGAVGQPDLVLGGGVDDMGWLFSDPAQGSSSLGFVSYDSLTVDLDENNNEASSITVWGGGGNTALKMNESGDVDLGGDELNLGVGTLGSWVAVRGWDGPSTEMWLISNQDIIADLDNNNNENGCFIVHDSFNNWLFSACEPKGITSSGPQAMAVQTGSGLRETYATGGTELWLEDTGSASLVDGQATVPFDALYAEMVNLDAGYQVFLTPVSDQPVLLFVSAKTSTYFEVQGVTLDGSPATASFDYRVVAKRLGYEGVRLATVERFQTVDAAADVPAESQPADRVEPGQPLLPPVTGGHEEQ